MKILISQKRKRQSGFAVVPMIAILSIMVIFVAVNAVTLRSLDVELNLLDKKQAQHWVHPSTKPTVAIAQREKP